MLFNSYEFVFLFLPATVALYALLTRLDLDRWATVLLVAASLFFYAWWHTAFVLLLVASVLFNFSVGRLILHRPAGGAGKLLLVLGVAANLGVLGYYKYANFFVQNVNAIGAADWNLVNVVLPLGISFFTFQQIAYLVDTYRRQAAEYDFLNYSLFVTFFPQLIAGPIVHHKEMMPQFADTRARSFVARNLSIGIAFFAIGLAKKVLIADRLAPFVGTVFDGAAQGVSVGLYDAWVGVSAYSLQIYFDFSGYSDMALGLARMFGIRLPLNFYSPYKAASIIDFWRRWHMTLSRFLRDYLYFPLGGNRKGPARRYLNLMVVMLLGGLWHGASWMFVIWGGLHGIFLCINHFWRFLKRNSWPGQWPANGATRFLSWGLTFLAFTAAWVFFRAENMTAAQSITCGLFGFGGFNMPTTFRELVPLSLVAGSLLIALFAPNTWQIMSRYRPSVDRPPVSAPAAARFVWRPDAASSALVVGLLVVSVLNLWRNSEFLYWQF